MVHPERRTLLRDKHVEYILSISESKDSYEYYATEHFRMSGMYWGLMALYLLGRDDALDKREVLDWVLSCRHECGGFGASPHHDPHLLYTLSALQILAVLDQLETVDVDRIAAYVAGLQQPDGSFAGDRWGEIDTRFSYCALASLWILNRMDAVDVGSAVGYIAACKNFDGGFGVVPGTESHAGQIFVCVAALHIAGPEAMKIVDSDVLSWWLCERQTPSGGLNGRPEKLQDVCYSWWCLSTLSILRRLHWIDGEALSSFILDCQDEEHGGISDRPEDMVDVYHTFFGIAGLSLLGKMDLPSIDPTFALPVETVERLRRSHDAGSRNG